MGRRRGRGRELSIRVWASKNELFGSYNKYIGNFGCFDAWAHNIT